MNFASIDFWKALLIFFCIVGVSRLFLRDSNARARADPLLLAAGSLTFFGLESLLSLGILLVVFAVSVAGTRALTKVRERKRKVTIFTVCTLLMLTPLLFFKYGDFLFGLDRGAMLLPVGISFYTFQLIGALADSLKVEQTAGPDSAHTLAYLNFSTFFPQIVAGPIERKSDLLPQIESFRFRWNSDDVNRGLRWIVLGLIYKLLIADNIGAASEWIHRPLGDPYLIHLGNISFGLRIYFDFAGYSFIALGLGRLLGIRLTENFRSPYLAANIRDFWRNWHRTLTQWFRDYIYIPLGGARSRWRWMAVLTVFAVSGLWHGAGWNFVLWGVAHGILVYCHMKKPQSWRVPIWIAHGMTLAVVSLTWLFFYEVDAGQLADKLRLVFSPSAYATMPFAAWRSAMSSYGDLLYLLASLAIGASAICGEIMSLRRDGAAYSFLLRTPVLASGVLATVLLAPVADSGFIYFNF